MRELRARFVFDARSPFHPIPNDKRATERLDLAHADLCGPFPASLSGSVYVH
jgi:hypothetical protein